MRETFLPFGKFRSCVVSLLAPLVMSNHLWLFCWLFVPRVWTTRSSGACPPLPQRSRRLSARGFLYWKSLMQRETPLGLAGIQGRLEGLVSRQGARQLNRHDWNFMCFLLNAVIRAFLACSCPTSMDCQLCPWVSPAQGSAAVGTTLCWQGLVLYSLCACLSQGPVTEPVLWSGWFRKQNIATTGICLCLCLAQSWGNTTSLIFSALHLIFNAVFTSCPAPSLSKPLLFHLQRNVINHILNSKGIFLIPVDSLAH